MENKKLTIGGLVTGLIVLVVVLSFAYFRPTPIEVNVQPIPEYGAVPGPEILGPEFCVGGLCRYVYSGTCNNATTTLFNLKNPYSATTTVNLVRVWGINGTTSIDMIVGTSTTAGGLEGTAVPSNAFIHTATAAIATGTKFWMENSDNGTAILGSDNPIAGANYTKVVIAPAHRIVGFATSSYGLYASATGLQGILGNSNTFSCQYLVEITK